MLLSNLKKENLLALSEQTRPLIKNGDGHKFLTRPCAPTELKTLSVSLYIYKYIYIKRT